MLNGEGRRWKVEGGMGKAEPAGADVCGIKEFNQLYK